MDSLPNLFAFVACNVVDHYSCWSRHGYVEVKIMTGSMMNVSILDWNLDVLT